MFNLFESWRRFLNEIQYGKGYPMGDQYYIYFHSNEEITIRKHSGSVNHPKGIEGTKEWKLETDPESYNYIRKVIMSKDQYQIEVTKDELLRGRYGKMKVVHKPDNNEDDDDFLDFNF